MQNRRLPELDGKGMGEWLNETDQYGNGIRVPATYYIDLYRQIDNISSQRSVQQKQEDPV